MANLDKQIKFFEENFPALLDKYEGTFLVVSEELNVDAFSTLLEAYTFGVESYGLGKFLLRECREGINDEVHFITPNIVLA